MIYHCSFCKKTYLPISLFVAWRRKKRYLFCYSCLQEARTKGLVIATPFEGDIIFRVSTPPEKQVELYNNCYQDSDCTGCDLKHLCKSELGRETLPINLLYRWVDTCCRRHESFQPGSSKTCSHRSFCDRIREQKGQPRPKNERTANRHKGPKE